MFQGLEEKIVDLYEDVYYFVLSKVQDSTIAEDIAQATIEKALLNVGDLRKRTALKSWIMQIAMNEVRLYFRSLSYYFKLFSVPSEDETETQTNIIENIEDLQADILGHLIDEESKINIMKSLDSLDEKYKIIIRLKVLCEYNLIQIGELLGMNVNTVRTQYARGLRLLREAYLQMERGGLQNGE